MATGTREQAKLNMWIVIAIICALPMLASPIVISMMSTPEEVDQQSGLELAEGVRRIVVLINEDLLAIRNIRTSLTAEGDARTADSAAAAAEANPELIPDLNKEYQQGKTLQADKLMQSLDKTWTETVGAPDNASINGITGGAGFARSSFADLDKQIQATATHIQKAKSEIAKAPAGSEWASRMSATIAMLTGRMEEEKAKIARSLARDMRMQATAMMREIDLLRTSADAMQRKIPSDTINDLTQRRSTLETELAAAKAAASKLESDINARRGEIARLRKEAADSHAAMVEMEIKPFEPTDPLNAGDEFTAYRTQFEALSMKSRQAEARAESLQNGALTGGGLVPGGDMLTGDYENGTETVGVPQLESQLAGQQRLVAQLESQMARVETQIRGMSGVAQKLESSKSESVESAAQRVAACKALLTAINEKINEANAAEAAAFAAYTGGVGKASAAATAAGKRVKDAQNYNNVVKGDQVSERLKMVMESSDDEASATTLAANLAWSAGQCYLESVLDLTAHSQVFDYAKSLLGDDVPAFDAGVIEERRTAADQQFQAALTQLNRVETIMKPWNATVGTVTVNWQKVGWQVMQLKAGVQWMLGVLHHGTPAGEDALAAARALLTEALEGRADSPLLGTAADALDAMR